MLLLLKRELLLAHVVRKIQFQQHKNHLLGQLVKCLGFLLNKRQIQELKHGKNHSGSAAAFKMCCKKNYILHVGLLFYLQTPL